MAKSARAVPPSFLSRNVRRVGRLASVVRGASDAIFDFALNWLFFLCSCPHREIRARARRGAPRGAAPAAAAWIEQNSAAGLPAQELYDMVTGMIAEGGS